MKLYTSKAISPYLNVTERRVRQLRDEGIITEARPGLYELVPTMQKYIRYLNGGSKADLNTERARLTRAKRENAELENRRIKGELHETAEVEKAVKGMCLNFRNRLLTLPAKLSPTLAAMGGNQAGIFDVLRSALEEAMEEMRKFDFAFAEPEEQNGKARE